jgi:hypothetical protein
MIRAILAFIAGVSLAVFVGVPVFIILLFNFLVMVIAGALTKAGQFIDRKCCDVMDWLNVTGDRLRRG